MSTFSTNITKVLAYSREEASRLNSAVVLPEHLLLGILRDESSEVLQLFFDLSIDIVKLRKSLEERVMDPYVKNIDISNIQLSDMASNIMRLSVLEARRQVDDVIDVSHLLLAILHDDVNNGAKITLNNFNISYDSVLSMITGSDRNHLHADTPANDKLDEDFDEVGDDDDDDDDTIGAEPMGPTFGGPTARASKRTNDKKSKTPALDKFSVDLTAAAAEGKLDPCVGREKEIQRMEEIICRRKKNNPILIGEPGVGKSAIVEGLAQKIQNHDVSPILFNKRLLALDLTGLVAGTKYRGQFEERIKMVIRELEDNPDIIIFIDEIHTMIGAGAAAGSMDAANILKPSLARGTIQCIGATTLDEYRKSIEKDGALERRFQKIIVEPTTADETLQILHNLKPRYEQHHHVTYTDESLSLCVKLTERYITDRAFPDKAIDAMDEVGARKHLSSAVIPPEIAELEQQIAEIKRKKKSAVFNQNFELAAAYRDEQVSLEEKLNTVRQTWEENATDERPEISADMMAEVISQMSGVPVQRIAGDENQRLRNLAATLSSCVIGQPKAIEKVVKAIQRNRMGLRAHNRPIGVFMFLGPTGVGKTYLAQKLAEEMLGSADSLIRVDMSEYNESFNTSRLVGAPPGYVGFEEGGQLTERVRRHPYSVVLLDEIEKAHPNVYNILLQVLDEGRLTDGNGRLIDFRNTIIIMTSNAGTKQLKDFGRGVGFQSSGALGINMSENDRAHARSILQKALSKQFQPEFLNRLDDIITFDQLDMEAIRKIIHLELRGITSRLKDMGYNLRLTDGARDFIAEKGYDVQYGARPLKRAIQVYVEDIVCDRLLSGNIKVGDDITITKADVQSV